MALFRANGPAIYQPKGNALGNGIMMNIEGCKPAISDVGSPTKRSISRDFSPWNSLGPRTWAVGTGWYGKGRWPVMTKQHNAEMCQSVFHRVKKSEGGPSNRLLFIEIAGEGRFMIAARRASPKIEGVMPEHHALSFAPNETMHHGKEALRHAIVQKWTGPLVTCWYGMMVRKVA